MTRRQTRSAPCSSIWRQSSVFTKYTPLRGENDDWDEMTVKEWGVPAGLGDAARQTIHGHDLSYYLDRLREGREHTLAELRKRDDTWLMQIDNTWLWGPTNNYCKWFHVCEHESNHNGQIKWIKGRLPDASKSQTS